MNRCRMRWLLAGALALALPAATRADEIDPDSPPPARPRPALTDARLKAMLENMGFEPSLIRSTSGVPMYKVTAPRDGRNWFFYASLSNDKSRLWLSAPLAALPEPAKVRPDILEKLLAKNFDLGPTTFSLRSGRMLYLDRPLENRGVTPGRMRKEIDSFLDTMKDTESLWNPAKYPPLIGARVKAPPARVKKGGDDVLDGKQDALDPSERP